MSWTAPDAPPDSIRRIAALADRDPRRAARMAARLMAASGTAPVARAWSGFAQGWALVSWERFDGADRAFAGALAAAEEARSAAAAAHCRLGQALIAFARRPSAAVVGELAAAAQALEAAGAQQAADHALVIRAALLNILGQASEASAALDSLERRGRVGTDGTGARWRRVRAAAAYAQGDYAAAGRYLDEATQIFGRLGYRADLAKCWYERGALAIRAQRYQHALEQFRRADRLFTRLDLPFRQALCAHDSGHALIRLGAYDQALAQILRALSYFTTIGRDRDIARCYLLLGNLFWYIGAWEPALAGYRCADALLAATGMLAGDRLTAQRNCALVYRAMGRLDEAWALLEELERAAAALAMPAEHAAISLDQARLLADYRRHAEALARYQEAHDQLLLISNHVAAATSRLEQGWLLLAAGAVALAREQFLAAAPALEPQPQSRWRNEYGLARCAEVAGASAEAWPHYQRACATVAALRGSLASEIFSSAIYLQAEALFYDALRLALRLDDLAGLLLIHEAQQAVALRRTLHTRALMPASDSAGQLAALQARLQQLDATDKSPDIAEHGPQTLAAFSELFLSARLLDRDAELLADWEAAERGFELASAREQLCARYGDGWTALAYVWLDAALLIVVLTADTLYVAQELLDASLEYLLERACGRSYRRFTYDDLGYWQGSASEPWAGLAALGRRLIPPAVLGRLNPDHRLIIVPSGRLHALPWAALRLGQSWLVEQAQLQLAPSFVTLQRLGAAEAPAGAEALLIGCRSFQDRALELPGVAAELTTVAARLPATSALLLDSEATCAGLLARAGRQELARYSVLHIASHAQLLPANGRAAHIKLWDGNLGLREIAGLQLGGALVVLSACEGADAELLPGEEALSLSRAFLAAGARGVVASLWPVYEQAALLLMDRFYSHLARRRDSAAALALAQRELASLGDAGSPLASPRCWASFIVVGDSRLPGC